MKNKLIIIFLAFFTFISIISIWPDSGKDHDAGLTSAELELEEKTEKDSTIDISITTYTFVNASEETTFAIDRGYAVREAVRNAEGKTIEERYFDADGNPVELYDSYYGIKYEYRDHEVIIRYMDSQGNEMPLATYSIIVRTLDDDGRAVDDYYYDLDMQPIKYAGYYGMHRDYDNNGWNNRVTYLDENGQPVLCSSGYAIKEYKRDADGTITGEFYFDAQKNPTKSSLGEYGQLYERDENGRISQITYLGSDGNAATNSAGYAILKRTYHRDGTWNTDMYFDKVGNPVALSKWQYGIKNSGKIILLLDKNGHVMLCVDNILNGFPFMVVVFGCMICLFMLVLPKKLSFLLTCFYTVFILYETLMFREIGDAMTNLVLFSYAGRFFKEQSVRVGVINNIWLFVPLGTGLYRIFQKKWVLLIPFVFSVLIETTQYITGLGIAEFDDVFGNTLGGWIGVLAAYEWMKRSLLKNLWKKHSK